MEKCQISSQVSSVLLSSLVLFYLFLSYLSFELLISIEASEVDCFQEVLRTEPFIDSPALLLFLFPQKKEFKICFHLFLFQLSKLSDVLTVDF